MSQQQSSKVIPPSYLPFLVLKCLLLFAAGIALAAFLFYFFSDQKLGESYQESFLVLAALKKELVVKTVTLYATVSLLIIAGIVYLSVMYSHRVAGPIIRLSSAVENISAGNLTGTITLRRKDVIMPLAEELNGVLTEYRQLVAELREMLDEVKQNEFLQKEDLQSEKVYEALHSLSEKAAAMERKVSGKLRLDV